VALSRFPPRPPRRPPQGELNALSAAAPNATDDTAAAAVPNLGADTLGGAVLRTLTRSGTYGFSSGVLKSMFVGALTLGFLPVVEWTRQFRAFARFERQQLWHLAEWLRLQTGRPEAAALQDVAQRVRWRPELGISAVAASAAVLVTLVVMLWRDPAIARALVDATAGRGSPGDFARLGTGPMLVIAVWVVGLTVAYGLHWLEVRQHAASVRRFVDGLNQLLAEEQLEPVAVPPVGIGAYPVWLAAGAAGVLCGAAWAAPAALAGALHRRYINVWSPAVRFAMAERVRTMLLARRPSIRVPRWGDDVEACPQVRCGAMVPSGAGFCPRCGTRVKRRAAEAA
jgi:hypothetical protein